MHMQNTTKQSKLIKVTTKHNVSLYKHNKTESEVRINYHIVEIQSE